MSKPSQPTHDKTIDGLKFSLQEMEPFEAYPVAPRVGIIMLPVLPAIVSFLTPELMAKVKAGDIDSEAFLAAILADPKGLAKLTPTLDGICRGLADPANAKLPSELLARTTVVMNGEVHSLCDADDFKKVFRGRFYTMLKAMWWSATVNFGNFSSGA